MNIIDIILGILLFLAAVRGLKRGMFVEVASVAALVLGIWVSVVFSKQVGEWISQKTDWDTEYMGVISFALTFIAVVVLTHIAARLADRLFKAIALGMLARLAGLIIGVVKTAFFLSIILIIIEKIEPFTCEIIPERSAQKSVLYNPIRNFAPNILTISYLKKNQSQVIKKKSV